MEWMNLNDISVIQDNILEVKDYLIRITEIFQDKSRKYLTNEYLYRGQKKATEHVLPAIMRENMFDSEAKMIREAYSRRPVIFKDHSSHFERLTRLQHYGLKTRLLDLTLNPLVALYFACNDAEDISNPPKDDGVVYVYDVDCFPYNSKEIQIHSAIAEMDLKGGITIEDLVMELKDMNIISSLDLKHYEDNNYADFINILTGNYFVISNLSNERLIQQCGAFYMPGCIEIDKETRKRGKDTIEIDLVKKTKGKGPDNYQLYEFTIPANSKAGILKELDYYNINKASLFPEFEYQMSYITSQNRKPEPTNTKDLELSSKFVSRESSIIEYQDKSKEIFREIIEKNHAKGIENQDIMNIFEKRYSLEWYKKDKCRSQIKSYLKRFLVDNKYPHNEAIIWINTLFDQLDAALKKENLL